MKVESRQRRLLNAMDDGWDEFPKAATVHEIVADNERARNIKELLSWIEREPENFCRAAVDLATEVRRLQREGE